MTAHRNFPYKRAREEIASGERKRAKSIRRAKERKLGLRVRLDQVMLQLRNALDADDTEFTERIWFETAEADNVREMMCEAVAENKEVADYLFLDIYRCKDSVLLERLERIPVYPCLTGPLPATTMRRKHRAYALAVTYKEKVASSEESSDEPADPAPKST